MNKINLFQKRFLIYALLLHVGVGISFFVFNGESEEDVKEENKRIVEVNIAAPKPNETITAETFSEEDLAGEMADIASMQRNFSNNNKLNEANVKESKKELQALQNQSKKVKNQLIKDKKKLQKEKRKIEEDKKRAQKDKERLEKEKRDLEKELKKMKEEAKKKVAKKSTPKKEEKKVAKKMPPKKTKPAKKELTKSEWLNTPEGNSSFVVYSSSLMGKIKGKWIRPSEARAGWECKLEIRQDRNGQIKGVRKLNCKPNNNKFYQSVYQAVMQSSPLPTPKDKRLFDERVTITFSVE